MKLSFTSLLRSLAWVVMGIIFGFALIWLIIVSPMIFREHESHPPLKTILHEEFCALLAIALIGGAFADYVLSVCFSGIGKFVVSLLVAFCCFAVFFVFSKEIPVKEEIKYWFTVIFCIISAIFCVILKGAIFYQEEDAHKKLKNFR